MKPPDRIEIHRLQVPTHIGVPDEERSAVQTVLVSLTLVPTQGFAGLHDEIHHTIDYADVARSIQDLAASRPRKLIETLAEDCATHLFQNYPLAAADIRIEKRILPDADFVSVSIHRSR